MQGEIGEGLVFFVCPPTIPDLKITEKCGFVQLAGMCMCLTGNSLARLKAACVHVR